MEHPIPTFAFPDFGYGIFTIYDSPFFQAVYSNFLSPMKLSNTQLKYLKSLHLRKFRQKYHNFMVEGAKMVAEVMADGQHEVEAVFATPDWAEANFPLPLHWQEKLMVVAPAELKKISTHPSPNQVLAILKQPDLTFNHQSIPNNLSLYLDDIRDPGNFGTILRIADWFGIQWVFCSENCVELYNPKTINASMGAFLRVKCLAIPFTELKAALPPDLPVCGAVLEGTSIFETDLPIPSILIIGNESQGISSALLPYISKKISIPKSKAGGAESLNAAVATGILCAQFMMGK
ncbi:MAG: RNA methyltransferase [Saprospiraceae bacterium]